MNKTYFDLYIDGDTSGLPQDLLFTISPSLKPGPNIFAS